MKNKNFPTKKELSNAVLHVLNQANGLKTTSEINNEVAKYLSLSEEILQMEDSSGLGTVYNYRMRWIRSELKESGLITNPHRGKWLVKK